MLLWWTVALATDLDAEVAKASSVTATLDEVLVEQDPFPPCTVRYALDTRRVPAARASSALTEGSLVHDAARAIDGDPGTAWVEGAKGVGRGESLRLKLDGEGQLPAGVMIVPGYARDAKRWQANQRVAKVLVRWLKPAEGVDPAEAWDRDQLVPADTAPLLITLVTEDGQVPFAKRQLIDFGSHFHQNMEVTELDAIDLVILETDGREARYEDTCVSEVAFAVRGKELSTNCDPGWCGSQAPGTPGCG